MKAIRCTRESKLHKIVSGGMCMNKKMMNHEQSIALRVSTLSIFVNLLLSIGKLFAGIVGHSGAMISDAVHSASDVISTVVVIIGVKLANKKSDKEHPYGHERLECVSAIILAGILLITGIAIGISGIEEIIVSTEGNLLEIPGKMALIAAIVSIVVKEWMYWYTRIAAKKIKSGALMADAWHHRSDSLSSIGAFIGIAGARMGYPILDSVASVTICFFVAKAAIDIFRDAIDKMVDHSCDEKTVDEMKAVIQKISGVGRIDLIHTRLFASKIYVDIEIAVDETMTLKEAHEIAEKVHETIEMNFNEVKHCMVHVNPMENSK